VILFGHQVHRRLDRRVEHLGNQHDGDGEQQHEHLALVEAEQQSHQQHQHDAEEVEPHMALGAHDGDDAFQRVAESFQRVAAFRAVGVGVGRFRVAVARGRVRQRFTRAVRAAPSQLFS
jgi:histidinol dehydrogenase